MSLRTALRRPNPSMGSSTTSAGSFITLTRVAAAPGNISLQFISGTGGYYQEVNDALARTLTLQCFHWFASFLLSAAGVLL